MSGTMTRHPLVSIIINNYNYGRFLRSAIDSALSQSYPNIEVIVVDDGSIDDSRDIMAEYSGRIIPVLKENGGQAAAFNAGFARSGGAIVIFLDADDMLLPQTVERVVQTFNQNPHLAKVQYRLAVVDSIGRRTGSCLPPAHLSLPTGDLRRHALRFPDDLRVPPSSGNAFSASVLREIFPVPEADYGRILADLYMLTVTPLFGDIASLNIIGGYYRAHGGNNFYHGSLDLDRTRQIIARTCHGHRYLKQFADRLRLPEVPQRASDFLSVTFIANRLLSYKLGQPEHPIRGDSTLKLFVLGIRATLRHFDLSPQAKLVYLLWFAGVALGPKQVGTWLGEKLFFSQDHDRVVRLLSATGMAQPTDPRLVL